MGERISRNRLQRLRARMSSYRERSRMMEEKQTLVKREVKKVTPKPYNLFCREMAPPASAKQTPDVEDARSAIRDFDEDLFDSRLGDSGEKKRVCLELCWLCGELCQSVSEHTCPTVRCLQCDKMFSQLSSFSEHMMMEHEGLLT